MRIGIDVGGTFTDFVLFDTSTGHISTHKILSTPENPARGVLEGLGELDAGEKPEFLHGSTVATNALLERKGARTALIATKGFRDVLAIGRQTRTSLYDFFADRPEPLVPRSLRFEVAERVDYRGEVIDQLDLDELPPIIERLKDEEVTSVAVALLFSFLHKDHEESVARALREVGFFVSPSSEILPEFREFERTSTTVINAYVAPIVETYLGDLHRDLATEKFYIMQSNGGLARSTEAKQEAVRAILSGPAGGVVGARYVAELAGFERVISFDMGGTSTDVSLCDGEVRTTAEAQVGGFPIRIPVIDIHTVGSGGGSIARVDRGGALRVGPESAGASPGPVCYGSGGEQPTVTDANLALGRLAPDFFLDGSMALVEGPATRSLLELGEILDLGSDQALSLAQQASLGVVDVVNAQMARAVRVISVERGFDPADFVLLSFGGAGGLHAVELARSLGIPQVLIPPGASTLSAFGMLAADVVKDYVQTVMVPGETKVQVLEERIEPLLAKGVQDLVAQGVREDRIQLYRELDLRYVGQGYELTIPFSDDFQSSFFELHKKTYGHAMTESPVEVVNLRVRAVGSVPRPSLKMSPMTDDDPHHAQLDNREVVLGVGEIEEVPFYRGDRLLPGNNIPGPAIVVYKDTTVYLPVSCQAVVDGYLNLVVEVRPKT
jgi:N-methylhydantoinase A